MDLLWMMLLVVLVRSEAQNVTEVRGELGGDVTLTCSFSFNDIYWFMEIHNKMRAEIGQIYSLTSPRYSSPEFKSKYLIQENRLVVRNLTAEDSRLYFCGTKTDGTIIYRDPIRLIISDVPGTTAAPTSSSDELLKNPGVVTSLALNAVLVLVLVLGVLYVCLRKRNRPEPSRENLELQFPQYEEIQQPPPPRPPLTQLLSVCIYSKVQLPVPHAALQPRGSPGQVDPTEYSQVMKKGSGGRTSSSSGVLDSNTRNQRRFK